MRNRGKRINRIGCLLAGLLLCLAVKLPVCALSDGARLDRALSDGAQLDRALSDGAQLDRALSDGARLDRALSDSTLSDSVLSVGDEISITNEETGYQVRIEDDAGLLSETERKELARQMVNITAYGNAMFKTVSENSGSTPGYARELYRERFGSASGTLFLIDMDNRNIWIRNGGRVSQIITDDYSDTITDNCYTYASRGDYYGCAQKAFSQIETLLKGQRIAQPMKYICNAFLAVLLSLLLTLGLVRLMAGNTASRQSDLLQGALHMFQLSDPQATYTRTTKKYDPPSSDSSGSSSGGGSGGGGGSSSGGGSGGGHSF